MYINVGGWGSEEFTAISPKLSINLVKKPV